jgi:hypothetical protein
MAQCPLFPMFTFHHLAGVAPSSTSRVSPRRRRTSERAVLVGTLAVPEEPSFIETDIGEIQSVTARVCLYLLYREHSTVQYHTRKRPFTTHRSPIGLSTRLGSSLRFDPYAGCLTMQRTLFCL